MNFGGDTFQPIIRTQGKVAEFGRWGADFGIISKVSHCRYPPHGENLCVPWGEARGVPAALSTL